MSELKSKEERVKESISLLKQIQDLGITTSDPSYIIVKEHLTEWIKSDNKHIQEHIIEFPRYGRKAILTLPWKNGKSVEFFLKKPRNSY